MGRAQELAVGHPRHQEVVGVARLADDFGPGVHLGQRPTDDAEFVLVHFRAPMRISSEGGSAPLPNLPPSMARAEPALESRKATLIAALPCASTRARPR